MHEYHSIHLPETLYR